MPMVRVYQTGGTLFLEPFHRTQKRLNLRVKDGILIQIAAI
jgi:hypothetical protein